MAKEEEDYEEEDQEEDFEEEDGDSIADDEVNRILKNQEILDEKLNKFSAPGGGAGGKDSNFLHVQISTDELLKKLENFYRGRVEKYDPRTNTKSWVDPEDKRLQTFNDIGVASMMEIVSRYIDKNTTLSSYREERIFEIIGDLGDDLILFIQTNYKEMGMDTPLKKTKFRMIITTTCHIIESAYRRALHGMTLEKLNETKAIHQFETPNSRSPENPRPPGFLQRQFQRFG